MKSPDVTADDLAARFAGRVEPAWAGDDPKLWALALDRLVHTHRLEAAAWAATALTRAFPGAAVFASQDQLLREAPPATDDDAYEAFADDLDADLQLVRRRGADALLFVFTGVSGRAGMALPLAHRWFAAVGAHVAYLRDQNHQAYNQGVRSLGADYAASLDACWRMADRLGVRRVMTCGNSLGGYAALRYGLDLGASATVAFSGLTSMAPPLFDREDAQRFRLRFALDLRPFLAAAPRPRRITMVHGAECGYDARHADHIADLPGVEVERIPECSRHESVLRAVQLGRYADLVGRLRTP